MDAFTQHDRLHGIISMVQLETVLGVEVSYMAASVVQFNTWLRHAIRQGEFSSQLKRIVGFRHERPLPRTNLEESAMPYSIQ